ncbi:MAG: TolC family protein [Vicinamibacterales bacterium]
MKSLSRYCIAAVVVLSALAVRVEARQAGAPADGPPLFDADPVLRGYVARALARYPALEEARLRHEAALEQVPQARALPEPVLAYTQAIQPVETRVGPQFNSFGITQMLPWFGVRDRRAGVAQADADTAAEAVTLRQRDVILAIKQAYYELAYVDEAIRTTNEERLLLEQYERLATSRYASGQGLQQAVVKLQAEITRVLTRREDLSGQRLALAARLNTLMDEPPGTPVPEIAALAVPPSLPDRDALIALGRLHRPELLVIAATETKRERALDLAGTLSLPTFTIGASYVNVMRRRDAAGLAQPPPDDGKNPLAVSVAVTLPIRESKYDAAVQQASREVAAERTRYRGEENALALDVEDQLARLRSLAEQTALFERALVPQAEEALRSAEASYATGQVSVLDLLDSERVLLQVRLVLARQRSDRLIARAKLERAIGTVLPDPPSRGDRS